MPNTSSERRNSSRVTGSLSSKELAKMMLLGQKSEVIAYLKDLPHDECEKMRMKLVKSIENMRKKKYEVKERYSLSSSSESRKTPENTTSVPPSSGDESYKEIEPNYKRIFVQSAVERANTELKGIYKIGEVIGKGGFGTVLKGISFETGDFVAIKQIDKEVVDEGQLPGVMKEASILKRLNHPNILKIYNFVETPYTLYFVLEYIESGSLAGLVKKYGVFPEPLISRYVEQTLRGLDYLHKECIIHRDIKGDNILITKDGKVKLADFGTAKLEDAEKKSQTVVGTPYWMAPEVIEMSACGPSSDIWSVGCTVIELLTGAPPYFEMGPMSALFNIVEDRMPPFPQDISDELKSFLRYCFKKDPKKRPSAQDLLSHQWIRMHNKNTDLSIDLENAKGTLRIHNNKKTSIINVNWAEGENQKNLKTKETKTSDREPLEDYNDYSLKADISDLKHKIENLKKEKQKLAKEKSRLDNLVSKVSTEKSKLDSMITAVEIALEELGIDVSSVKKAEKAIRRIQKILGENAFQKLAESIKDSEEPEVSMFETRDRSSTM